MDIVERLAEIKSRMNAIKEIFGQFGLDYVSVQKDGVWNSFIYANVRKAVVMAVAKSRKCSVSDIVWGEFALNSAKKRNSVNVGRIEADTKIIESAIEKVLNEKYSDLLPLQDEYWNLIEEKKSLTAVPEYSPEEEEAILKESMALLDL
jgi:hypothetical protein